MGRDELVRKMCNVYYNDTVDTEWSRGRMSTALDVAIEGVLSVCKDYHMKICWPNSDIRGFSDWVWTQLDKVKTPEERVTIGKSISGDVGRETSVWLDGQRKRGNLTSEDAEIYRLGLIQKLKE